MIMFMQKGQVTHIVNVVAIYCIICILNDHVYVIHCKFLVLHYMRGLLYYHVYVKGTSDMHSQCFSDILYKRYIILSCLSQRGKWHT